MTTIKARLQENIKEAMRAKDTAKLGILRFISAAIKQREIDERIELSDAQCIEVFTKMAKQRREAIEQFNAAGRTDLVEKESAELALIETLLPAQLEVAEIDRLIAVSIKEQAATSIKDMSKVMSAIRPQIMGRADMALVSQKIKEALSS